MVRHIKKKTVKRKTKAVNRKRSVKRTNLKSIMKNHLIMIDPQNDFCDPKGALFVPGADADMKRLADFILKNGTRINEIHCTLDSHQTVHIAHPIFWRDSQGNPPPPFSLITKEDVVTHAKWAARHPQFQNHAIKYVTELEKHGRYQLMIWPPHCLIGSWGHSIVPAVQAQLADWERNHFNRVDFVAKGSNFLTEHYSGVQADVPDPADASTKLNTALIDALAEADNILITGEALSHCVANTITDIANAFGADNVKKFILLQDTSSNVPRCDKMGEDFVKAMVAKGMRLTTTADW